MNKKMFWFRTGLILTGIALLAAYYPTFTWMTARFLEPDSYYSHGFIIPLISAVLVWRKRRSIAETPQGSSLPGLWVLITGILAHIAGIFFQVGFVSGLSLVAVLLGLALYLFGTERTKLLAFPVLFLLFMVPLPKVLLIGLTFKMKMMAAYCAAAIAGTMHIALERSGSMIYLANGVLTVGDECSGINSLVSLLMLSVLFAHLAKVPPLRKSLFVFFSLPVALAANIGRIVFLILAAHVYGVAAATEGILHYGAGVTLWIVALALLGTLWRSLTWETNASGTPI